MPLAPLLEGPYYWMTINPNKKAPVMHKYLLIAALAAVAVPAMAQTPAAPAGMEKPSMEQMKAKMAEHHAEMVKERDARRAEMDAKMDKCFQAGQAAKSPEEMKTIHENCRKEGQAMHEKFKAEREQKMGDMKQKREEWKAKKDAMKAAAPVAQ